MADMPTAIYQDFKSQMREKREFSTDEEFHLRFKVFYSSIQCSPVMVLGYNPGGSDDGSVVLHEARDGVYPRGVHDYVACRGQYKLASRMYELLDHACRGVDGIQVADIPKANLIFRRSRNASSLPGGEKKWLSTCAPYVRQMLELVRPHLLVFEQGANKSFQMLRDADLIDPSSWVEGSAMRKQGQRGNPVAYYVRATAVLSFGRKSNVGIVCMNHPSSWTWWDPQIWANVKEAVRQEFQNLR